MSETRIRLYRNTPVEVYESVSRPCARHREWLDMESWVGIGVLEGYRTRAVTDITRSATKAMPWRYSSEIEIRLVFPQANILQKARSNPRKRRRAIQSYYGWQITCKFYLRASCLQKQRVVLATPRFSQVCSLTRVTLNKITSHVMFARKVRDGIFKVFKTNDVLN